MADRAAVVFVHVPRTGGTTLNAILRAQCRAEQALDLGPRVQDALADIAAWDPKRLGRIRVVMGHVPYGFHEQMPGAVEYVTLLREPVRRVMSFYNYVTQENQHYLHDFTRFQAASLENFVRLRATGAIDNFQVRLVSGVMYDVPFGELDESHLELAIRNLEQFAVVGLTERFDESLLLMQERFGWRDVTYERPLNTSRSQRTVDELAPAEFDALMSVTRLDAELFEYGRALFRDQMARRSRRRATAASWFSLSGAARASRAGLGRSRRAL